MRKCIGLLLSVALIALTFVPSAFAAAAEIGEEPGRYIVFYENVDSLEMIKDSGGDIIQIFEMVGAAAVDIKQAKLEEFQNLGLVKSYHKENHFQTSGQLTPWAHTNLNLKAKVPSTLTGKGVKVAIIDTGVDSAHEDLTVKAGKCTLDESISQDACKQSFLDENGHGTHVAGIIAAKNNNVGIVGVAPGAEIFAVKALDGEGNGTTSTIMAGIEWAISQRVHIINMSLTTPYSDMGIKSMVDKANQNGILVIAAAGNEGSFSGGDETVMYPAKYESVMAVSSVDKSNRRVSTSSTGYEVEIAAPGEIIYSTIPSGGYGTMSGTSMAAPFVAGIAALYKEKYPGYTNKQIRSLLQKNARDLGTAGRDRFYGFGIAQADTAPVETPQLPITYTADGKGSFELNMQPLLEKYQSYSIYRGGKLIAEKASSQFFRDYGAKGSLEYLVYPWLNGVKQTASIVDVSLNSPAIPDLTNSAWYSRNMMYLYSEGILKGDASNYLKPASYVTRAEAVTMLGRALKLDGRQRSTKFTDVPSSSFASGYIQSAVERGIISGLGNGTFNPNASVTRAEMSIMISKAYNLPAGPVGGFSDVPSGMSGYQQIYNLAAAKIVSGYADGTFKPNEKMLRSNYSVFLSKANNSALK
ncbi:S8 family serine peptidase [Bacillus sp. ISL-41]|uniref:S8 family peptidase n=1 Tax=Bacillus sp. ISL-41 TaxID=2819127 RepID=UPI001BE9D1D1|nr:S8 family serine peptidase [Bacillus sp. ISL-41]MBT2641758.1 S8 family serine peptidase [Bacillus sp. ISL-41]